MKSTLGKLSRYKLTILLNGSPKMLAAAVENAGLRGVFTDVISADEVKIYKSSPRVYGLVFAAPGRAGQCDCLRIVEYLGHRGRQELPVLDMWLNRCNLPEDELGVRPDVTVDTLDGLIGVLGGIT